MAHTATYVENPKGKTLERVLSFEGKLWTQRDPVGSLCRHLGDGELRIEMDGKTVIRLDVAERKNWLLTESPQYGLRRVPYKPFPAEAFAQKEGR